MKEPIVSILQKCYLCEKASPSKFFKKLGYWILKCPNCGLLSLDFNKDYSSFLHSYYQKGYFTGDNSARAYADYEKDKANVYKNSRNLLNKIKYFKKKGNILDIGCAMGFFLEEAEKAGFESFGVEVSKYAYSFANSKFGQRIYLGAIEEFFQRKDKLKYFSNVLYDVVTLSDLIEHVKDPRSILQNLKKSLKKDGVIVIQTGDADSLWAKLMGKNWHFFAPPQHLYFFSRRTITELLNQAGFEVIKITHEGKYISLRYLFHMLRYANIPLFGDLLHNIIGNSKIGELSIMFKLYDNMIIFARPSRS